MPLYMASRFLYVPLYSLRKKQVHRHEHKLKLILVHTEEHTHRRGNRPDEQRASAPPEEAMAIAETAAAKKPLQSWEATNYIYTSKGEKSYERKEERISGFSDGGGPEHFLQ